MKGLVIFIVALALFGWWYKTKDEERTRISKGVYEYVLKACNDNTECVVHVRDYFSGCFSSAYEGGFLPGRGSVDNNAFVKCFNADMMTMKLVVTSGAAAPGPSQTSRDRARIAGRSFGTLLGLVVGIYVAIKLRRWIRNRAG